MAKHSAREDLERMTEAACGPCSSNDLSLLRMILLASIAQAKGQAAILEKLDEIHEELKHRDTPTY